MMWLVIFLVGVFVLVGVLAAFAAVVLLLSQSRINAASRTTDRT